MRILWLVKGLGPGGAERLLVAAAGAHQRDGFDIEVVYLLPWKNHLVAELEQLGVRTTCLDVRDERDLRWAGRLRAHLRAHPVDVVHSHSPYAAAIGRLVVRSLPAARRPVLVSTEHNPSSTYKWPTRVANAATAGLDAAVFAVSDETWASMSPKRRERAEVLVHGIDIAAVGRLRSERAAARAELGVEPDTVLVGTVANYHPKKDWPNFLHAARRLADRDPSLRFCAVGQGPLVAEVKAMHAALQLDGIVTLTGYRPDATRLMAGCDIFVLASKWEGLPVALMEASALGLPIVATRVGGIPQAFRDGTDALLVDPGSPDSLADAIERLARDRDLRRTLGTAAQCRSLDFDVVRAVARVEAVYREVGTR
jgi:glycosyltransferase involved in cell wall biosynthesis